VPVLSPQPTPTACSPVRLTSQVQFLASRHKGQVIYDPEPGTVPLSVAGVTRCGPVDGSDVGWDVGSEADREAGWGRTVPLCVAGVTHRGQVG
jgi:hypothetical protein